MGGPNTATGFCTRASAQSGLACPHLCFFPHSHQKIFPQEKNEVYQNRPPHLLQHTLQPYNTMDIEMGTFPPQFLGYDG